MPYFSIAELISLLVQQVVGIVESCNGDAERAAQEVCEYSRTKGLVDVPYRYAQNPIRNGELKKRCASDLLHAVV